VPLSSGAPSLQRHQKQARFGSTAGMGRTVSAHDESSPRFRPRFLADDLAPFVASGSQGHAQLLPQVSAKSLKQVGGGQGAAGSCRCG